MPVHEKRGHRRDVVPRQIVPVAGGAPIPLPQKVPPAATAVGDSDPIISNLDTQTVAVVQPTIAPVTKPTTVITKPTTLVSTPASIAAPTTSVTIKPATTSLSLVTTRPKPTSTIPTSVKSSSALSSVSASASATNTAAASGGMSTGALVGGIAAGLVALLGLIGLVMFLLRRWRKRNQHAAFNAAAFRRQSTALVDNTHGLNYEHKPRPPSMIERKMTSTPTSAQPFGQHPYGQQQYDGPQYDPHFDQPQYTDHPMYGAPAPLVTRDLGRSLSPAHAMNSPATSVPASPSSAGFFPNPYGQMPNSPLHSPISPTVGPYESQYNGQSDKLLRPNSVRDPAAALRVNSVASDEYDFTAHYVDLDRSSVTPYQAAQYAEISRRLNDGDSNGRLLSVAEGPEEGRTPTVADFPAVPAATHFPPPQQQRRRSLTSVADGEGPFTDPRLQPPSPSFARERIASKPPMLPEIERGSGYDFPVSARASPRTAVFPIPGQEANQGGSSNIKVGAANGQPGPTPRAPTENADKKRPDTFYAEDDAYGGI